MELHGGWVLKVPEFILSPCLLNFMFVTITDLGLILSDKVM